MATPLAETVSALDLQFDVLDPNSATFVRLFTRPGGEWDQPEPQYRNGRVDPPDGFKDNYAVLYVADSLPAVATETGVLWARRDDTYLWSSEEASRRLVARYQFVEPALFIPIDGGNEARLGLAGSQRKVTAGYKPFQVAALALWQRFGRLAHGLSWASFHRNRPGRVYGIWHDRKTAMGLVRPPEVGPFTPLPRDIEWLEISADPQLERVDA